jgi:hypothetical protein
MKIIITESQNTKVQKMLLDLFDEIGYIKTIKKFKLGPEALDKIFPEGISEIEMFDDYGKCNVIDNLIDVFFKIGYLKGKSFFEYNNKSYEFKFYTSPHMGSLMVDIIDLNYKDSIGVYATPFYEGNCGLPIDVDMYVPDEEGGGIQPSKHINYYVDLDDTKFKTFSDITNWFNNDYPYIILKEINPLWNKFRNGMF